MAAITSAPQFPDLTSQWEQLQNQTGFTGLPGGVNPGDISFPGAGDISFPGAGGIGSFGDLQNQTLPGGNLGTGFFEQLQNQTIPDVGQIQGMLPGGGGAAGGDAGAGTNGGGGE